MQCGANVRNGSKADSSDLAAGMGGKRTQCSYRGDMKRASFLTVACAAASACSSNPSDNRQCHFARPDWAVADTEARPVHRVALASGGQLTFDGVPSTHTDISARLNDPSWSKRLAPAVAFERDPTLDCQQVEAVRKLMATTRACREKHCTEVEPPLPPP
jgi:hypothetical protein